MTRILFFTVDGRIGGTEKMVISLATGLLKEEFSVAILTIKPIGSLHRSAQRMGVPAYTLDINIRSKIFLLPFRLYRFLLVYRPNILQSFLFSANIFGRLVGKAAGVPIVVGGQRSTDPWRRFYHNVIDRLTSPLCRFIVSNSQAGRRMLLRTGIPPEKVMVIPNGVPSATPIPKEEAKSYLGFSKDTLLVGSVGNLRSAKGYQYLLPAFREVIHKFPGAKLLISGAGPLRKDLEDFSGRLGLSGSVSFLGFQRNLSLFYSALDVFVLPSLWEGMPVALLEAFSHGLPVVATSVSGIPEVVTEGQEGFLVEPANPQQIAQKIIMLLEDEKRRLEMGRKGKERVEKDFSQDKMVSAYVKLYRDLIKGI